VFGVRDDDHGACGVVDCLLADGAERRPRKPPRPREPTTSRSSAFGASAQSTSAGCPSRRIALTVTPEEEAPASARVFSSAASANFLNSSKSTPAGAQPPP
jgi:hypothetical protein